MNTPWLGGSGGAYPTPYYSNGGASPSAYYPSAEASSLPDGGTVVGGALLLFLGVTLFKQVQENGLGLDGLFKRRNAFNEPPAQTYKPSYYGVTSQKNRIVSVTDVPNAKPGQQYSNALIDLGNQMRHTRSLQAALNHQESDGYEDFLVGEGKAPTIQWGKHSGTSYVNCNRQILTFTKELV